MTASRCASGAFRIITSPPVIAAATISEPASIRSGITVVLDAVQPIDAFDFDHVRAGAGDLARPSP